jgi:hypothetical protein
VPVFQAGVNNCSTHSPCQLQIDVQIVKKLHTATTVASIYLVTNQPLTFKAPYLSRVLMFECKLESVSASHAYYTVTSGTGISLYSYFLAIEELNTSVTVQLVMFHYITYQLALLRPTVPASCHEQTKHQNQKTWNLTTCVISLNKECTNPEKQVFRATKFYTIVPHICGFSLWNLLPVTQLAHSFYVFLKNCEPLQ